MCDFATDVGNDGKHALLGLRSLHFIQFDLTQLVQIGRSREAQMRNRLTDTFRDALFAGTAAVVDLKLPTECIVKI